MVLLHDRSHLNLRLPLPEISVGRPCFPVTSTPAVDTACSDSGISINDLEKINVLGSGSGGIVYKVRHRITSELYALKTVNAGTTDPTVSRQLRREMDILRSTDSEHVIRCHGVFERPSGEVSILMEYMDAGTLESTSGGVSESQIRGFAQQILKGLSYLHSKKIVHRDIKPANLLLNSKKEVKIADFGVSKILVRMLDTCNSYVGTFGYMSPERIDPSFGGGDSDPYAGDIWSVGITLLEVYLGYFPLSPLGQRPDWATLACTICLGEPPHAPEGASEEFKSFISCCLQKDSTQRWTASKLLSHPFLTGL